MPSRGSSHAARFPRSRRGFSALELLWALVLLGILAAWALPAWSRTRERAAAAAARDAFALLHYRARLGAVHHGRVTRLHIAPAESRAWWEASGEGARGAGAAPGTVVDFAARFRGLELQSNREVLCFGAHGLPVAGDGCDLPNATVTFRVGAAAETLTVSVAGRVAKR